MTDIPIILQKFNNPTCKKCNTLATMFIDTNNACGDPECCGEIEYYWNLVCPVCNEKERISTFETA